MSTVTDEIKARVDLVDLVGRTVSLRRSGSAFKGLCPFHQEKTPSFYVFPDTRTYVCFGCGKKGSAFDWLMEREHLDFGEALRTLAQVAGVDLPERRDPREDEVNGRLLDLLARAQAFYQAALKGASGAAARRYLAGRGVSEESIDRFGLGYAPTGNALLRYLREEGASEEDLVASGLVGTSDDGRHYDFFRDRVLFPIRDPQGRTVAFGGRALDDATPKYLNSRDTLLFHKQETLFGLDQARKAIAQERRAVLVEGYMDVVTAHQHGYRDVVAALGTAVTARQLGLVRRVADEVVLALDSDAAGQAATLRAIQMAVESLQAGRRPVVGPSRKRMAYAPDRPVTVKVLTLPGAKDPDELIRSDPRAWPTLLNTAQPIVEFAISQVGQRHDLSSATGKAAAAEDLGDLLASIANPVEQAHYAQRTAEMLGVPQAAVHKALRPRLRAAREPERQSEPEPARAEPAAPPPPALSAEDPLDEYTLALLLRAGAQGATAPDLGQPQSRALLRALRDRPQLSDPLSAEPYVSPELVPQLHRVHRRWADVERLRPEHLERELETVRLLQQQRTLLHQQSQVRGLLRDASEADEQRRWMDELSGVARALDDLEERLRQVDQRRPGAAVA